MRRHLRVIRHWKPAYNLKCKRPKQINLKQLADNRDYAKIRKPENKYKTALVSTERWEIMQPKTWTGY